MQPDAKAIGRICPDNAVAVRIGGDEFAMIASCCGREEIHILTEKVKNILRQEKNGRFTPSVAFGAATKTNMEQDLQVLIREADKSMYQQKEYDRRSGRRI